MVPSTKENMPGHLADAFPKPDAQFSPPRYISPTVEDEADPEQPKVHFTTADNFGIYCAYAEPFQCEPQAEVTLDSVCDSPTLARDNPEPLAPPKSIFWLTRNSAVGVVEVTGEPGGEDGPGAGLGPFANKSQFRLYDWWYNSSVTKSLDDFDGLLDVFQSNGFSLEDLTGFRAHLAQEKIDNYVHPSGVFSAADGWTEGSVNIPLPKTKAKYKSESDAPTLTIKGIFHRRLTEIIHGVAEDEQFAQIYQWIPHRTFWRPTSDTSPPSSPSSSQSSTSTALPEKIRVYTDTYNSDAAYNAHEELRKQPRNPADALTVRYVVFPINVSSDATHLTSFESASLWPIYLYFGALSKYIRGMPTQFTAQHLAYIPSVSYQFCFAWQTRLIHSATAPDSIQDTYMQAYGTAASADVMTFCKRELMQKIWLLLLDDTFMDAYKNGILVVCGDGVTQRIFPRFMTYSADYPEKYVAPCTAPTDVLTSTSYQDPAHCLEAAGTLPLPSMPCPQG